MDDSETIINRITRDGVMRFSELTQEERQCLLDSSRVNVELFDLYVEFRRTIDAQIRDQVLSGTDVTTTSVAEADLIGKALGDQDVDKMGEAAMNAFAGAKSHALLLAKRSTMKMLGDLGKKVPDGFLESLLKARGL